MKITYLKLENAAGLLVGNNKNLIEIDFTKNLNKIISIQGKNGIGKSCLLSALTPFSSVSSSIDERGSLSFIKEGKDGYKEIHYSDEKDLFIIKHFYKAQKTGGHSVKSYFSKNKEELNKNGNVTSFIDLVEIHFGLTPEMVRLIRLGSNVSSFINLQPSRRKEYIGKLITEIETYLQIYKKIGDDIKVLKVLISTNANNISNCNISDLKFEENELSNEQLTLIKLEKEKEKLFAKISKLKEDKKSFSEVNLTAQLNSVSNFCNEFELIKKQFEGIENPSTLPDHRKIVSNELIELKSKSNSLKLQFDLNLQRTEEIQNIISKFKKFETLETLETLINNLRNKLKNVSVNKFNFSSDQINSIINTLISLNNLGKIISSFDNHVLAKFITLKKKKQSIQDFIKKQSKQNLLLSKVDLTNLLKTLFKGDLILVPNCDSEFKNCPFYRLSEILDNKESSEKLFSPESLQQLEILNQNFNLILEEIEKFKSFKLGNQIENQFKDEEILSKIATKSQLFELSDLNELLFQIKLSENYIIESQKLVELEEKLDFLKQAGVEKYIKELEKIKQTNLNFKTEIEILNKKISLKQNELKKIDQDLNIILEFTNRSKFISQAKQNLVQLQSKFEKFKTIENEFSALNLAYSSKNFEIENLRLKIKETENKIETYKNLVEESKELSKKFHELTLIHDAVSTKKGIPVFYIKSYLAKIHQFTNQLLSIVYDGNLKIEDFKITLDSFEIPYSKNGIKVSDIKYGSQSEVALVSMALSFALSKLATSKYNILLLDEIDAGLDDFNRNLFLQMLNVQMHQINAEQVFIISHNLANGMISLPLDVIKLSETTFNSKLFNIIYE